VAVLGQSCSSLLAELIGHDHVRESLYSCCEASRLAAYFLTSQSSSTTLQEELLWQFYHAAGSAVLCRVILHLEKMDRQHFGLELM